MRPSPGPVPARASQAILMQKPFWPPAHCRRAERGFQPGFRIRFSKLSFSWLLLHGGQLSLYLRIRQKA